MLILGIEDWREWFSCNEGAAQLEFLYGNAEKARDRYLSAYDEYFKVFGHESGAFFSAPGRTELSGNHTDHQQGYVLAGAVVLDMIAVVYPRNDMKIRIVSEGYQNTELEITELLPGNNEKNTTAAIARGVAAGFVERGYKAGGFDVYIVSDIPLGGGLSSSAAIEVLFGTIQNVLYNHGEVDELLIAKIGQYAENHFFEKPSGLMDQAAIALGGVSFMDFSGGEVHIERLDIDFSAMDWEICVVDAGGSHEGLTAEYSAITDDMKAVAQNFGKSVLSEVNEAEFYAEIPNLRERVSDRAILRAMHFYAENARVLKQLEALKAGDMESYKELMLESGRSSYDYLQNTYSTGDEKERSICLALCLSERILSDKGAWRVHGGGFAGTIQALVQRDMLESYTMQMQAVFGDGSVCCLRVRPLGGYCFS